MRFLKSSAVYCLVVLSITLIFTACGSKPVTHYPAVTFKPLNGSTSGGAIQDNLTVKTVEKWSGSPLAGTQVFVHQGDPMALAAEGTTGADGTVSFAGKGISGAVTITAVNTASEAYDTLTFMNVNAPNVVLPMVKRKGIEEVRTALRIPGLGPLANSVSVFRNEFPFPDVTVVKEGNTPKTEKDPIHFKVEDRGFALSALVNDTAGNTTQFGYVVETDGPVPVETPAVMPLMAVTQDTVKVTDGTVPNPPANLEPPSTGWDPARRYSFAVFTDGGIAGPILSGFGNIFPDYKYQAFCCNLGLDRNMYLQVSAFNRNDFYAETTMAIRHGKFDALPEKHDFQFKPVPADLSVDRAETESYPTFKWLSGDGQLDIITIRQDDYDYTWEIYAPSSPGTGMVALPPLTLDAPGSILVGEIYSYRVETWTIPGFNFNAFSFDSVSRTVTHKARSKQVKFMIPSDVLNTDESPEK